MPPPFVPPRYETKVIRYGSSQEAMNAIPQEQADGWEVRQMIPCMCTMVRESQHLHPDYMVVFEREK
jgi:hypothetical protein